MYSFKPLLLAVSGMLVLLTLSSFTSALTGREENPLTPSHNAVRSDIETDLRVCLGKAIGIGETIKYDKRYNPRTKLNIPIDIQSTRYATLIKRVSSLSDRFSFSRFPSTISVRFGKEYFEDDDNGHLKDINEMEWEIICHGGRKYTIAMNYFIYGSLDPRGQIRTTFNMSTNTYTSILSVGKVDGDSDSYIETEIKIENDVVVSYSKRKSA